jgi:hypothetical protein
VPAAPPERRRAIAMTEAPEKQPTPSPPVGPPGPLPAGYRQGLVTAITVILGFSLAFFRFWGFEAPGEWTPRSVVATGGLVAAVLLQVIALVRSLRLEDETPTEYRKTVKWFTASVVVLLVTVLVAVIVFSSQ